MAEQLLTVPAVARQLGLSKSAVYAMAEAGLIACYRLKARKGSRGVLRFDQSQVDAYLESCKVGAAGAPNEKPRRYRPANF